ncbi:(2Fe-2S)-binding protein [Kordiimonas sp. SCSIO 12610]|uniref:(2Fe-2S)-binding protein n=1 Tax=Kordiimonas sp. SCSIO 12610 TaxID=2829597 RepID=UPI00210AE184|nr:(2Fe-2S)-binding protein [Kordiimonas sp. SCSIO 12610]
MKFQVNDRNVEFDGDNEMPLLWYLRDIEGMTGTKFGCGAGLCGACTVHVDGVAVRSCQTPMEDVEGAQVKTIEGMAEGDTLSALQQAWSDNDVPQCGYCQAGQIMQAAALLSENPSPTDQEIEEAMYGNICRCGTYQRIKNAIRQVAKEA